MILNKSNGILVNIILNLICWYIHFLKKWQLFLKAYFFQSTHELALIAAGSTIDLVDRVVSGEVQNGAALVRPPGHHAMASEPCGYCFYNNVALAAKHAIDKRGLKRLGVFFFNFQNYLTSSRYQIILGLIKAKEMMFSFLYFYHIYIVPFDLWTLRKAFVL